MYKDVYICRFGHCWLLIKTHVLSTILSEWLTNTKMKENSNMTDMVVVIITERLIYLLSHNTDVIALFRNGNLLSVYTM